MNLKVISGGTGSGKSFLLTKKVVDVYQDFKVLVLTKYPIQKFVKKLKSVGGDEDEILLLSVKHIDSVSDAVKFLIKEADKYEKVFMDEVIVTPNELSKLLGFTVGANIDLTTTFQTPDGISTVFVTEYSMEESTQLEEYNSQDMKRLIKSWT